MHNYDSVHGQLPPAAVCGSDGRPLLSWRVLILPYIEQQQLYDEFRQDEPWDSPHNLTLLPRMPPTYAPPPGKAWKVPPHHTVCKVFVGPGAAFEGREGLRLHSDFPDGTSKTFLVVEAGKAVPWTKPEDIAYDPKGALPDLTPLFSDMFRVALADGSVRHVPIRTREETIRAAISRNGGEELHWDP
jgi:hypothetical protein